MLNLQVELPDDDSYWNDKFSKSVLDPDSWILVARELIFALSYLKPQIIDYYKSVIDITTNTLPVNKKIQGVYMLLSAYAVENLMKAIIIKNNFSDHTKIEKTPKEIKSHDLLNLALKSNIKLTDSGVDVLKRMSYFSVWAGRYPAPISIEGLKQESPNFSTSLNCFRGFDLRAIDEIILHCAKILQAEELLSLVSINTSDEIEDWERVVMQNSITPYNNRTIKGNLLQMP